MPTVDIKRQCNRCEGTGKVQERVQVQRIKGSAKLYPWGYGRNINQGGPSHWHLVKPDNHIIVDHDGTSTLLDVFNSEMKKIGKQVADKRVHIPPEDLEPWS